MQGYHFLTEIRPFELNNYIGLIGWIGNRPHKIYASKDFHSFYLHDEEIDKLFMFEATLKSFEGEGQYEKVLQAYQKYVDDELL